MIHIFCKMKSYMTCKSNKRVWIIMQTVSSLFVPRSIQCFLLLKTNNLHSEELIILHGMNNIKIISIVCLLYLYLSVTSHITDTSCTCSIIFFIRMFQFNFISRIGQLVFALEQGWWTFLRARAQIVYTFQRNPFVCQWEFWRAQ